MNTHKSVGNEGKATKADHVLPAGSFAPALIAIDTVKVGPGHAAFDVSPDSGESLDASDTSPLRVSLAAQYTHFGMERLYGELAALKTEVERMRHVKRCLLDIVRSDFHRAHLALPELGDFDRESFKLHVRLSTRDTGLESLYQELKPIATVFKRNTYLRRRLYDAFNANHPQPLQISVPPLHAPAPPHLVVPVQAPSNAPMLELPSYQCDRPARCDPQAQQIHVLQPLTF